MKAKTWYLFSAAKLAGYTLLLVALFTFTATYAQSDDEHNEVFTSVEHTPEFPGGMQAFYQYVTGNIKYPQLAKANKVDGRVIVTFIVEKDGSISNVRSLRSPDESLSQEALRVMAASPKWKPGTQNKHNVRVQYTVPIVFALDDKKPVHNQAIKTMPEAYYVINGKPATVEEITALDVNTIESINVLKDKMAVEKYGDKGAKGVIEIVTKKP